MFSLKNTMRMQLDFGRWTTKSHAFLSFLGGGIGHFPFSRWSGLFEILRFMKSYPARKQRNSIKQKKLQSISLNHYQKRIESLLLKHSLHITTRNLRSHLILHP